MPTFEYRARNRSGQMVSGTVEAPDQKSAVHQLGRRGVFPLQVDPAGAAPARARPAGARAASGLSWLARRGAAAEKTAAAAPASVAPPARPAARRPRALAGAEPAGGAAGARSWRQRLAVLQRRPGLRQTLNFTRQLASLLKSGMALRQALTSLSRREDFGPLQPVIADMLEQIIQGASLSDALGRHPKVFSTLYVNMVRAGEASGQLHQVLVQLARYQQQIQEARDKVFSAMVYPAFIMLVGFGVVVFFITVMLPKFSQMFREMGTRLPLATEVLVAISEGTRRYWWAIVLALVGLGILVRRWAATEQGRYRIDGMRLKLPIFGRVFRESAFSQFARTLGTLLGNGVPVLTALKILEHTMTNTVVAAAIREAQARVTDGTTISQPLGRSRVFPAMLIDMLAIGEETGDMAGALDNIAETYEQELDRDIKIMTSMLEPIVIIVMALFVGFIIFSILMAVFELTSGLKV